MAILRTISALQIKIVGPTVVLPIRVFRRLAKRQLIAPLLGLVAACGFWPILVAGELAIAVVGPISGEMILPDYQVDATADANEINLVACRGEYEPASFVISTTGQALSDLRFVASDLLSHDGQAIISHENIDLRYVKRWYQAKYSWREIGKSAARDFRQTLVPELLLKDDSLVRTDADGQKNLVKLLTSGRASYRWVNVKDLANEESVSLRSSDFPIKDAAELKNLNLPRQVAKQIWVTFYVPDAAKPGSYFGEIAIAQGDRIVAQVPITLDVPSFRLRKSLQTYSIYYRGKLARTSSIVGSEYKSAMQMTAELRDMRQHGVTEPTIYQPITDEFLFDQVLRMRAEESLNQKEAFYLGIQTTANHFSQKHSEALNQVAELMPLLSEKVKAAGLGQLFVYGKDEAKGRELVLQRPLWEAINEKGVGVFVAGYTGTYGLVGDVLNLLIHARKPDIKLAKRWHRAGNRIFSYANPQTGPENPYIFRLNYGVVLWANEYDGAMPYAYQHCFGSCWNDIDHRQYRDHVFAYPTIEGVIPTLAWEGFREGVDDVRYIEALERAIADSRAAGRADWQQAQFFLDSLRTEVLQSAGKWGKYNLQADIDLDLLRQSLLAQIGRLENSAG